MNPDKPGKTPLRVQREALGKTQAQIAYESGLTEKAYRDIENGSAIPGLDTAIRISVNLGITLVEFAAHKGLDVSGLPEIKGQRKSAGA